MGIKIRKPLAIIVTLSIFTLLTGLIASENKNQLAWPVEKLLLTATFGESRSDHFHSGIDLGGDGQTIRPVSSGELVYYFDEAEHPLYRGFGNGNLMILQHQEGLRSYYYHMREGSVQTGKTSFGQNDPLGLSGNTGRSFGAHLHLGLSDRKGYLNPLTVLPDYRDSLAPEIASIMLLVEGRAITIPDKYKVNGIHTFKILARLWDTQEDIRQLNTLGIYEVSFFIDAEEVRRIKFDRLLEKDGRLVMEDGTSYEDVFSPSGYLIGGEYSNLRGTRKIRVEARDIRGNTSSKTVEISFN